MKKISSAMLAIMLFLLSFAFVFAGCKGCKKDNDKNSSGGTDITNETPNVGKGTSDVDIGKISYGFISVEDYKWDETTIADTDKGLNMCVDTAYYMLVEFDIIARKENNGKSLIDVMINFEAANILRGTFEAVGSGTYNEKVEVDGETGEEKMSATVTFHLPTDPRFAKTIKMVVRITPLTVGSSHVSIDCKSQIKDEFDIFYRNDDGFTRNLYVVSVQLDAPEISFSDKDGLILWSNVKNASYYQVYVDNVLLYDKDGKKPVSVLANSNQIELDIGLYKTGTFKVKVRACSTRTTDFATSNYSNEITVTL